jgi:peptide/nickel transport system substrate-binding protein
VRRAIKKGIVISYIVDGVFNSRGLETSATPVTPGLPAYAERSLIYVSDSYDPNGARELLSQAGYGPGLRELSLEITVPSNHPEYVQTAEVIVDTLKTVGIHAEIKELDWESWQTRVYRDRDFQAAVISPEIDNVSPRSFLSRYFSASKDNFINYKSPAFDRVYTQARTEFDEEKRIALYKEAQRIISDETASVFIQDIQYFKTFWGWIYGGILNYPMNVIDFASMFRVVRE